MCECVFKCVCVCARAGLAMRRCTNHVDLGFPARFVAQFSVCAFLLRAKTLRAKTCKPQFSVGAEQTQPHARARARVWNMRTVGWFVRRAWGVRASVPPGPRTVRIVCTVVWTMRWSHPKGATGRVRTGERPVLGPCHGLKRGPCHGLKRGNRDCPGLMLDRPPPIPGAGYLPLYRL